MQLVFASLPTRHRDAFIHIFADSCRAHRVCFIAQPVSSNILPPTPARPSTFLCPRNVPVFAAPSISQGDDSHGFMQQPVSRNPKGEADGAQSGLMSVVSKLKAHCPCRSGFLWMLQRVEGYPHPLLPNNIHLLLPKSWALAWAGQHWERD